MGAVRRICVVGNSGSGKTHPARRFVARLQLPHVELDTLNHRAGSEEAALDELRAEVEAVLREHADRHGGWVVNGNHRSRVGDLLHPDTYLWLDHPRRVVPQRVLRARWGGWSCGASCGTATASSGGTCSTLIPARTSSCGRARSRSTTAGFRSDQRAGHGRTMGAALAPEGGRALAGDGGRVAGPVAAARRCRCLPASLHGRRAARAAPAH